MRTLAPPLYAPDKLMQAAEAAAKHSYSPYSLFAVGAALWASPHTDTPPEDWQLFTGTNIENASYGLTICAERVAVFNAVSTGNRHIHALALWATPGLMQPSSAKTDQTQAQTENPGFKSDLFSPCGACRQVLAEFMNPEAKIGFSLTPAEAERPADVKWYSLCELLPLAFA
ncbi:MAG: cytidine deaminase [Vampirovibrionales bacterium]|nr:cytidine deaminase [Vampirovibrionales bacterium]